MPVLQTIAKKNDAPQGLAKSRAHLIFTLLILTPRPGGRKSFFMVRRSPPRLPRYYRPQGHGPLTITETKKLYQGASFFLITNDARTNSTDMKLKFSELTLAATLGGLSAVAIGSTGFLFIFQGNTSPGPSELDLPKFPEKEMWQRGSGRDELKMIAAENEETPPPKRSSKEVIAGSAQTTTKPATTPNPGEPRD